MQSATGLRGRANHCQCKEVSAGTVQADTCADVGVHRHVPPSTSLSDNACGGGSGGGPGLGLAGEKQKGNIEIHSFEPFGNTFKKLQKRVEEACVAISSDSAAVVEAVS